MIDRLTDRIRRGDGPWQRTHHPSWVYKDSDSSQIQLGIYLPAGGENRCFTHPVPVQLKGRSSFFHIVEYPILTVDAKRNFIIAGVILVQHKTSGTFAIYRVLDTPSHRDTSAHPRLLVTTVTRVVPVYIKPKHGAHGDARELTGYLQMGQSEYDQSPLIIDCSHNALTWISGPRHMSIIQLPGIESMRSSEEIEAEWGLTGTVDPLWPSGGPVSQHVAQL